MARLAVIGEEARVSGFALAGADVHPADSPSAVRQAWAELDPDVAVVILTPAAAEAMPEPESPLVRGDEPLVAVMPG